MKAQYYMLFHLLPQLTHAKILFFNTRISFWRWLTLLPVMGQFQLLGLLLVGVDQELSQQLTLLAQVQVPDFLLLSAVRVDHLWPLFCVLRHNLLDLCRGKEVVPPAFLILQVAILLMHFRALPPIYLVNWWIHMLCKKYVLSNGSQEVIAYF